MLLARTIASAILAFSLGATAQVSNSPSSVVTTASSSSTGAPGQYNPPPTTCQQQLGDCLSAPFPNHAFCTSQFCQCTGGKGEGSWCNGDTTTTTQSNLPPSTTPTPSACEKQLEDCLSVPFANHAFCTSQFCQCTGAKGEGSWCNGGSNSTIPPKSCEDSYNACVSVPGADTAACRDQRCSCDPSYCESCQEQEDKCIAAPNANHAFCSSQRCACDGVPHYCSHEPVSCEARYDACLEIPGTDTAVCRNQRCKCDPSYCNSCQKQEDECLAAPNASHSYCTIQRCACDGEPAYCTTTPTVSSGPTTTTIPTRKQIFSPTPGNGVNGGNSGSTRAAGNQGSLVSPTHDGPQPQYTGAAVSITLAYESSLLAIVCGLVALLH